MGRERQWRVVEDTGQGCRLRRDLSAISVGTERTRDAPAVPRSLPQRPDWIRIFTHGAGTGGGSFPGTDSGKYQPTRRAGAHHSGWRKRLGMVRGQWTSVSARVVPAYFRRSALGSDYRLAGARAI